MRKTFTPLIILVISFLSFIVPVKADTYNVNLPSNLTSLTSTNFTNMINTLDNASITYKQYCLILWVPSSDNSYHLRCGNSISYNSTFKTVSLGNCRNYVYNSDFTSLSNASYHPNCSGDRINYYWTSSTSSNPAYLIYSNFDLPIQDTNNTYNYIYIDKVYTMPNGTDVKVYSIRDMYIDYNTDPYPLFTSFFDIVFEKLQLVCEFFTSSYIYLSIFVIFILYFCILLLRRLL